MPAGISWCLGSTSGMQFKSAGQQMIWDSLEVIPGWYKGRFLYLFGDELAQFQPCLDAWSFLVPAGHSDRRIIGRNAYGALLVLEDGNKPGSEHIYLLDPYLVTYTTSKDLTLSSLVGRWLPAGELSSFTDDGVYRDWVKANEVEPELDDVLGFKTPRALGGAFDVHNIQRVEGGILGVRAHAGDEGGPGTPFAGKSRHRRRLGMGGTTFFRPVQTRRATHGRLSSANRAARSRLRQRP